MHDRVYSIEAGAGHNAAEGLGIGHSAFYRLRAMEKLQHWWDSQGLYAREPAPVLEFYEAG